jgi:anti-sigma factor RsiW
MAAIHPFIDNEIEDSAVFNAIAFHLQGCPACAERTERERKHIAVLRELLSRSCVEVTPLDVEERIILQIQGIAAQMQAPGFFERTTTQVFSQYRKTEITIDGETTIEIEESHEIRRDFPF